MTEQLKPNKDQQEDRAAQAKAMAESLERKSGVEVTLKGEAFEVRKGGHEMLVVANGDASFSISNGPSHLEADDLLKHIENA